VGLPIKAALHGPHPPPSRQYSPLQSDGIAAAAMFWNTVVAMWAIIWFVVYVTK